VACNSLKHRRSLKTEFSNTQLSLPWVTPTYLKPFYFVNFDLCIVFLEQKKTGKNKRIEHGKNRYLSDKRHPKVAQSELHNLSNYGVAIVFLEWVKLHNLNLVQKTKYRECQPMHDISLTRGGGIWSHDRFPATICKTVRLCYWTITVSCLSVCDVEYCCQTVGWIKMKLGTGVGLGPSHIVLDGGPSSPKRGHANPPFIGPCIVPKWLDGSRCHLVCRPQPWPHCVRWGPTLLKGAQPPIFGLCLLWPNGWMDQDANW